MLRPCAWASTASRASVEDGFCAAVCKAEKKRCIAGLTPVVLSASSELSWSIWPRNALNSLFWLVALRNWPVRKSLARRRTSTIWLPEPM